MFWLINQLTIESHLVSGPREYVYRGAAFGTSIKKQKDGIPINEPLSPNYLDTLKTTDQLLSTLFSRSSDVTWASCGCEADQDTMDLMYSIYGVPVRKANSQIKYSIIVPGWRLKARDVIPTKPTWVQAPPYHEFEPPPSLPWKRKPFTLQ